MVIFFSVMKSYVNRMVSNVNCKSIRLLHSYLMQQWIGESLHMMFEERAPMWKTNALLIRTQSGEYYPMGSPVLPSNVGPCHTLLQSSCTALLQRLVMRYTTRITSSLALRHNDNLLFAPLRPSLTGVFYAILQRQCKNWDFTDQKKSSLSYS